MIQTIDSSILLWIQSNLRADWLTPIMTFITSLGNNAYFWIATILILFCFKKTRKVAIVAAVSMGVCFLINNGILKTLVDRTRPYDAVNGLVPLVERMHDSSFPSGHTSISFSVAMIYYFMLDKRIGIASLVLATLIGFSRLYVGVHYPTDVLAGCIVGIGSACLVWYVYKKKYQS